MAIDYDMDLLRPDLVSRLTGDMIINRYAPHEDLAKAYSNGEYKIRCFLPGHIEKTPSLNISKNNFKYNCLGKCNASIKGGDFIGLIQVMEGVIFTRAVEIAGEMCGLYLPPYGKKAKPGIVIKPPIDSWIVPSCHDRLLSATNKLDEIKKARGYTDETIEKFKLGIGEYGGWTIPVYENGELVNIKYRSRDKNPAKMKYRSHSKKYMLNGKEEKHTYGQQRLFGGDILAIADKSVKVIICGGEYDAIRICQEGYVGITSTTGEGSWKKDWNGLLIDRDVYICMDNDEAGREANIKIRKYLPTAKIIDISAFVEDHGDITDFFNAGHGMDELLGCVKVETKPSLKLGIAKRPVTEEYDHSLINNGSGEFDQEQMDLISTMSDLPARKINPAFFIEDNGTVYITCMFRLDKKLEKKDKKGEVIFTEHYTSHEPLIVSSAREVFEIPRIDKEISKINPFAVATFKGYGVKQEPNTAQSRWAGERVRTFLHGRKLFSDVRVAFDAIHSLIKKYSKFSRKTHRGLVSLYIMGSYFYEAFSSYPYLHLHGEKGSGKSTLGMIISQMSFNGDFVINPTKAVLGRTIEEQKGLMVIDEIEEQSKRSQNREGLGQLLNAGYKRGAKRPICDTENGNKIIKFDLYCPKILCNIVGLNDTMADRCIAIRMQKFQKGITLERDPEKDSDLAIASSNMYEIMMGYSSSVIRCYQEVKNMDEFSYIGETNMLKSTLKIFGRERELYIPLLTIALFVYKETKFTRPWNNLIDELNNVSDEKGQEEDETPESILYGSICDAMEQAKINEKEFNMYELVVGYEGRYIEKPGFQTQHWISKIIRKMNWCEPYRKLKRKWVEVTYEKDGKVIKKTKKLGVFTITRKRLGMSATDEAVDIPF